MFGIVRVALSTLDQGLELPSQPWIKGIPETISHHIEAKNGEHNGQTRRKGEYGVGQKKFVAIINHAAPSRPWRFNPNP